MTALPTHHRLLFAAIAATCLILAACGDDDDSPDGTVTGTPASATGTPAASLDADSVQQLLDFSDGWAEANAKITYDFHSASGSTARDAQVVIYQSLPQSRVDIIQPDAMSAIISNEDIGYSCLSQGEAESCALLSASEAEIAADVISFLGDFGNAERTQALLNGLTELATAPSQAVAGHETTCLKATGTLVGIPSASATWCFTEDGLLLHQEFTGGSLSFNMTATAVEEAQDSDFDPPYPVVTVPPTPTP
jgi:hypothetical protein